MNKSNDEANPGFWSEIRKRKLASGEPIFVLAPMADVTDAAFRSIIAKYSRMGQPAVVDRSGHIIKPAGGPDAIWTEFVSADGLFLAPPAGQAKLMKDLIFTGAEKPIVAQFFTSKPEMMERAAYLASELGFDGIDINMGCPDKSIEKQGAGAALMKNPLLAKEIIRAAKRGAQKFSDYLDEKTFFKKTIVTSTTKDKDKDKDKKGSQAAEAIPRKPIPVSVKTRIGYNKNELETWLPAILEEHPAVVTIHARTRKELSNVPARWEHVRRAVEIRDAFDSETLIFGNGDVVDLGDARQKAKMTSADGVMLGRAIFGNPWLFDESRSQTEAVGLEEKLRVMVEHTFLFEKFFGGSVGSNLKNADMVENNKIKNFAVMKKHYKAYVNGFDGASALRVKLMEAATADEVASIVDQYLSRSFS